MSFGKVEIALFDRKSGRASEKVLSFTLDRECISESDSPAQGALKKENHVSLSDGLASSLQSDNRSVIS